MSSVNNRRAGRPKAKRPTDKPHTGTAVAGERGVHHAPDAVAKRPRAKSGSSALAKRSWLRVVWEAIFVKVPLMSKRRNSPADTREGNAFSETAPKPLWERLVALANEVPDEELVGRPTDIAEQHDHYVYG